MRINIPFHERFWIEIMASRKTMTTRSKRYGKIGDFFCIHKTRCIITGVERMELGKIVKKFYHEEGFSSPGEFKKFWLTIHRKWQPEKKFYLHTFKRDNYEWRKYLKATHKNVPSLKKVREITSKIPCSRTAENKK